MPDAFERRPWLVPLSLALLCVIFFWRVPLPEPGSGALRVTTLLLGLHVGWGAWGMEKLARSFGASAMGGLLAGIIFGFGSYMMAHLWAGHYRLVLAAAWGLWVLAAYRHALRRGSWLSALPGAAALGLAMLAGHLPTTLWVMLLSVGVGAYHVAEARADGGPLRPALRLATRQLAVVVVGGGLLSAVQWLPSADFPTRAAVPGLEFAGRYALPGAQLLSLALPNLLGNPNLPEWGYWGSPSYEEANAFASLWAVFAALLALRLKRRAARFYWVVMLVGLALSPEGALYLVAIALAGLSGLVLTHLQAASPDERRDFLRPALRLWVPGAASLIFGGVLVLLALWSLAPPDTSYWRLWHMADAAGISGLMVLGVGCSLWLWREDGPRAVEWAILATLVVVLVDLWRIGLPLVAVDAVELVNVVWGDAARFWPPLWRVGAGLSLVGWGGLLALGMLGLLRGRRIGGGGT